MTAHRRGIPVPARITMALNVRGMWGPQVDVDLGGVEPMVDDWEAGLTVPTEEQVERLAAYTKFPVDWFYRAADELTQPWTTFMCDRRRRSQNALTMIRSWVDWDGVLHVEQLTPDHPPYRSRVPRTTPTSLGGPPARRWPGRHEPVEDPNAPDCCAVCHLPLARPNARHIS